MNTRDIAFFSFLLFLSRLIVSLPLASAGRTVANGGAAPLFHRVCDACFGRDSCERVADQVLVCDKKTELCAVLQVPRVDLHTRYTLATTTH
jgi:hypothetical protein